MNREEAIYELKNAAWLGTDHCGAKNHPSGWKKDKHISQKATRKRLKDDTKRAERSVGNEVN